MKHKKILLVGGTGYIGTIFAEALKKEYNIVVTGKTVDRNSGNNVRHLDFSDETSIRTILLNERFDLIVILAARVDVTHRNDVSFSSSVFQDNVLGVNQFLRYACKLQKAAPFIFISSMTVYAPDAKSPVVETASSRPIHPYGLSKLIGEQIFTYYVTQYKHQGVILRLPGIFGGGRKTGYLYNIVDKLRRSEDIVLDAWKLGFWEALYINDLASMFREFLIRYPFTSTLKIFNIGYGEETDFVQTAYMLKAFIGSSSHIVVKRKDYRKFFMSHKSIAQYIHTKKYSYKRGLKQFLAEWT